jgi:hypothetical protein
MTAELFGSGVATGARENCNPINSPYRSAPDENISRRLRFDLRRDGLCGFNIRR